jgi:hypothetical protein
MLRNLPRTWRQNIPLNSRGSFRNAASNGGQLHSSNLSKRVGVFVLCIVLNAVGFSFCVFIVCWNSQVIQSGKSGLYYTQLVCTRHRHWHPPGSSDVTRTPALATWAKYQTEVTFLHSVCISAKQASRTILCILNHILIFTPTCFGVNFCLLQGFQLSSASWLNSMKMATIDAEKRRSEN